MKSAKKTTLQDSTSRGVARGKDEAEGLFMFDSIVIWLVNGLVTLSMFGNVE